MGLDISPSKSSAIVAMKAAKWNQLSRHHIQRTDQGSLLLIPMNDTIIKIPLAKQCSYLGITISYTQFEMPTITHRVNLAKQAFGRLTSWLQNRRLRFATRYQIWKSCVMPIMTYGVWPCGLHQKGLLNMIKTLFFMFREMLGGRSYRTHESHSFVLQKHRLEHPRAQLLHSAETFSTRARPDAIICILMTS